MHGRCISDILRDVLGLNKNGPELCNWIILDVRASLVHGRCISDTFAYLINVAFVK